MIKKCLHILARIVNRTVVVAGALALTLIFFVILPLMQSIGDREETYMVRTIETTPFQEPPEDIEEEEEEEEEKEEEEEETPPEFELPDQMLDLDQFDLALSGAGFGSYGEGAMVVDFGNLGGVEGSIPDLFGVSDLDRKPNPVKRVEPDTSDERLKRRMPGRVRVIFVVDEQGRVRNAKVSESTDAVFERPALEAIRKWRFEPGESKGKPVSCRMRIWIRFER